MFSYVDEKVRKDLLEKGKLIYLNRSGESVPSSHQGGPLVSLLGPIPMPRMTGGEEKVYNWYAFVRRVELSQVMRAADQVPSGGEEAFRALLQENMSVNSVIATPNFNSVDNPLVRIHSCCMTGDVFGSMRCECGPQLETAFQAIDKEGGAVVYMSSHEGRGIGLWAKAVTYLLQDDGQDTYQANVSLGLPEDSRDFTDAAVVLRHLLGGRAIRLLSNNPLKLKHLRSGGQEVSQVLTLLTGVNDHNLTYMRSKRSKGHTLPEI